MIKGEVHKLAPGDIVYWDTEMRGLAMCGGTRWKLVKASMSGADVEIKRGTVVDGKMVVAQ